MLNNIIGGGVILDFGPSSIAGLITWLDASSLGLNDNDLVSSWTDKSGSGLNFTGAGTARPTYKTNIAGGKPIIRFNGTTNVLANASWNTGLTQAEVLIVLKAAADPSTATTAGLWNFTNGGAGALYPWTDAHIYDDWGSNTRTSYLGAKPDTSSAFRLYNVSSIVNGWVNRLDTTQLATNGTNVVAWAATAQIGEDSAAIFWAGDIAEIVIYNSVLSAGNRALLASYFKSKYTLTGY